MTKHTYTFDAYTSAARRSSGRWATTDRGWLYANNCCYGYYILYPAGPYRDADVVLASVYDRVPPNSLTTDPAFFVTASYRFHECATVAQAQEWMLAEIASIQGAHHATS